MKLIESATLTSEDQRIMNLSFQPSPVSSHEKRMHKAIKINQLYLEKDEIRVGYNIWSKSRPITNRKHMRNSLFVEGSNNLNSEKFTEVQKNQGTVTTLNKGLSTKVSIRAISFS
jgi:hypothetical protein